MLNKITKPQYLLSQLSQECGEVVQRVSKIELFGLYEIQEGKTENNKERLTAEVVDLIGTIKYCLELGLIHDPFKEEGIAAKRKRIDKYINHARKVGRLDDTVN